MQPLWRAQNGGQLVRAHGVLWILLVCATLGGAAKVALESPATNSFRGSTILGNYALSGSKLNTSGAHAGHQMLQDKAKDSISSSSPKVFFLFLTLAGVQQPEIWEAFFEGAPPHQRRAFVHCKKKSVCDLQLSVSNPFALTVVDTVPTSYCKDLVSAMVQLLAAALAEANSSGDKFVFLSQSALPVKPFRDVYSTLVASEDSDVCIAPSSAWEQVDLGTSSKHEQMGSLVKHQQWVVLNRAHAQRLVDRWPQVHSQERGRAAEWTTWSIPVMPSLGLQHIRSPHHCADEWAIFATIFGAVPNTGLADATFSGLSGKPLQSSGAAAAGGQGTCRTFVHFGGVPGAARDVAQAAVEDYPATRLSCYPHCTSSHPAEFLAISDKGLRALRSSAYLFARKFTRGAVSVEKYRRIVESSG